MHGRRLFVKICGITSVADGLAAADAGADAVGFVFWPRSPRCVNEASARAIAEALPSHVVRVGVFVDASADALARVADAVPLDVLQLHGSESPEGLARLPRRAWKALHADAALAPRDVTRYRGRAAGILLDARVPGVPGGTGRTADWRAARAVREHAPFLILAGGLTPENVAEAIATVGPDGVDVSSGVERSPGVKDGDRLRAFVDNARSAT